MDDATLLAIRIPDFEAAIHKAVDLSLRDRPVVVVTSRKPLGRVVAASPEARQAGITEESHYQGARVLCPDAAFFTPDRRLAARASRCLIQKAESYSPLVERVGGDRLVMDTRGTERLWGGGSEVAHRLRDDVHKGLRLPVAAGLASRRPWSMLASRSAGEDGVCLVTPGTEAEFLDRVPVLWVDGLTVSARSRLLEVNIRTLGQLRPYTREQLAVQFGRENGKILWDVINPGAWDCLSGFSMTGTECHPGETVRVEAALTEATVAIEFLSVAVRCLAGEIAATLRRRGLGTARLSLTLLHADGVTKSAATGVGGFIQEEDILVGHALELLGSVFQRRVRGTRLWLVAEKLSPPERQGSLFPSVATTGNDSVPGVEWQLRRRLLTAVDGICSRYGDMAVRPAAALSRHRAV